MAIERNPDGTIKSGALNPGGRPKKLKAFSEFLDAMDPDCNKSRRDACWQQMYDIALKGRYMDAIRALELIAGYDMGKPATAIVGDDGESARFGLVILPAREGE